MFTKRARFFLRLSATSMMTLLLLYKRPNPARGLPEFFLISIYIGTLYRYFWPCLKKNSESGSAVGKKVLSCDGGPRGLRPMSGGPGASDR